MNDLEEIKQRIDIVSFINDYLPLKKAGRNFKALCPFHSEKTPSFIVSPERQIWHCFGCGEGGDIFTFLMTIENLEFPEALEILAKKAGVKLSRTYRVTQEQKLKEEILTANRLASQFYHYLLVKHKIGEKARDYLKKRKINPKIVETFTLGYAPSNWDSLFKFLKKKNFTDHTLIKSGLIIQGRQGRFYDRFRGRLIFTLRDHRGNVIGFSGRKLPGFEGIDREAKYINTSETPVYIKGNVFYGLDVTKEAIRKANEAIIVEGEFDLLSSFQAGVTNVVAIKGTALTTNQANLLKRFCETVIFSLDSDLAGDEAVRRGIETAENAGFNIKVVIPPVGKDPDECIKENPLLWKKAVAKSIPVYDFLLQSALKRFDRKDAYGKRKIVDEVLPFYSRISNMIIQSHYLSLLAKTIDISQEKLSEVLEKISKGRPPTYSLPSFQKNEKKREVILEEYFLSLLLQSPTTSQITEIISGDEVKKIVQAIENPAIKKIVNLYFEWISKLGNETPQSPQFIKSLPSELTSHADKAYLFELGRIIKDKILFKEELQKVKCDLLALLIRRRMRKLSTKIKETKDETSLKNLNQEFNLLKEDLRKLDRKISL